MNLIILWSAVALNIVSVIAYWRSIRRLHNARLTLEAALMSLRRVDDVISRVAVTLSKELENGR